MNDTLRLEIPAKNDYIMPVRLFISGIAARLSFSVEDIEDLKLITAEACTTLLCGAEGTLELCVVAEENGALRLTFSAAGGDCHPDETAELSRMIIEAYASDVSFKYENGKRTISFCVEVG